MNSGKIGEGNVSFGFGFADPEAAFSCYGEIETIYQIQEGDGFDWFSVDCFDAWEPNHELFDSILEKFYPAITYELMAEEPGCEVFINTDKTGKYFPYRYRIVLDRGNDEELIEKRCENIEKVSEVYLCVVALPPKTHLKNLDQVEDYLNEKLNGAISGNIPPNKNTTPAFQLEHVFSKALENKKKFSIVYIPKEIRLLVHVFFPVLNSVSFLFGNSIVYYMKTMYK